jgi:glycine/D-amino acid oxidase-like deaminating enzyme
MHVGVLGGGLQGCCAALALAERGVRVTISDRNDILMSRAAVANEGKIHLGYMYAGDPTLKTASTMLLGALAFAPFFQRTIGLDPKSFRLSAPAAYVVHRDSQHDPAEVLGYANAVHELVQEAAASDPAAYFGIDLPANLRRWSNAERDAEFDGSIAVAAVDTPEVAIQPIELADAMRAAIADHPSIDVRLGRVVQRAKQDDGTIIVTSVEAGVASEERYDHVINALWDGRIALDQTLGIRANRPWLHRLKYGVSFRLPSAMTSPRSATFVSGPFGEVVAYPDGLVYLTWYPECIKGMSADVSPPGWDTYPAEPLRSEILQGTLNAMAEFIRPLRALDVTNLAETKVKGGVIVAWGDTDIYDPESELHRRYEIGVTSAGNYHSVDPGKLTMAPYFANVCVDRIKPRV